MHRDGVDHHQSQVALLYRVGFLFLQLSLERLEVSIELFFRVVFVDLDLHFLELLVRVEEISDQLIPVPSSQEATTWADHQQ